MLLSLATRFMFIRDTQHRFETHNIFRSAVQAGRAPHHYWRLLPGYRGQRARGPWP